jgi:hypothetical protein
VAVRRDGLHPRPTLTVHWHRPMKLRDAAPPSHNVLHPGVHRVLALQIAALAGDYAWFVGSSALLLTLPVLVEIQRETTVMVMQRQRETEIAQIQEQARMQNAGVLEQIKGMGQLLSAGAGPGGEAR